MTETVNPAGVLAWRRPWLRGLAVALVLLLLALTAVQPFTRGVMPLSADGPLHMYRTLVLDHSLRCDGTLWPRYSSGLAYGYGAPLFNHFSPLTYHLMRLPHLLGLGFVDAYLWSMAGFLWLAAGGAYLLGRAWSDEVGGLVTAAAYVYAPYLLFDVVTRGTSSEVLALAVLPWVMWGLRRLVCRRRRVDFLLAVATFAAFIPLHNVVTLQAGLLLVPYGAFLWLSHPARTRTFVLLMLAALLAVGLTVFFWWPALAEVGHVHVNQATANLPLLDVAANLLTPGDLFSLPRTADPAQLQAPTPIAVGWPALLLAVVGVILSWRTRGLIRVFAVWGTLLAALLLALHTTAAAWVWEHVPLLGYSQFPWRLLGPTSLLLAVLAGIGAVHVADLLRQRNAATRFGWLVFVLAVVMIYGIPWLYRVDQPALAADSITDWLDYEAASGQVAAGSYGEYLPAWNDAPLDPGALRARFAAGEIIARLESPPGVTVDDAEWRGTSAGLSFRAGEAASLVFDWLYVPGWHAAIDGQPLTVAPQPPLGLVAVDVPAGEHTLSLWLGPTPLQTTAVATSLGALLIGIGLATVGWRWLADPALPAPVERTGGGGSPRLLLAAGLVGLAVFLGKTLIVDHVDSPLRRERFPTDGAALVDVRLDANFGGVIDLLGADLPDAVPSGAALPLDLFWRLSGEPVAVDYSSTIMLRDPAGNAVASGGSFMPGDVATRNWLPGAYVQERLLLVIPPGTPPGIYTLEAGLYDPQTLGALSRINEAGNPADVKAVIGPVTVTQPDAPALPAVDHPVGERVTAGLRLLGLDPLPDSADAGQEIAVVWQWRADSAPTQEVRGQVVWLDESGEVAAAAPGIPLTPGLPVMQWGAGDAWTGRAALFVPGRLEAGNYTVAVRLVDESGTPLGDPVAVGLMMVRTPDRDFTPPDLQVPVDAAWVDGITLLGYDRADTGEGIHVTLYWQAANDLTVSLRLFVHLLDPADHIVAQWDGVPVDWARPTTGWAPGEIVTTQHDLAAGPGEYRLRVGWYDPVTGDRVPLAGAAGDFLLLPNE